MYVGTDEIYDDVLKHNSLVNGLVIPDDMAFCGYKTTTPSFHELELANRKHRWPEMQSLHIDFFNSLFREVTEVEDDILAVLNLPKLNEVRESIMYEDEQDIESALKFKYTGRMERELTKEFNEWIEELIGTDLAKKEVTLQEATYPYWMVSAGSVGLKRTQQKIRRLIGDRVFPVVNNDYLRAVITRGGSRIKTRLALEYLPIVRKHLKVMAKEGRNPMQVARWIHKNVGEGQAWYWNRIARSESGLAVNGAYNASAERNNIPYEQWSAASDACPICAYLDGRIWERGNGPEPVSSSHPFCRCDRSPIFVPEKLVEQPWRRTTPYDRMYTPQELEYFRVNINS